MSMLSGARSSCRFLKAFKRFQKKGGGGGSNHAIQYCSLFGQKLKRPLPTLSFNSFVLWVNQSGNLLFFIVCFHPEPKVQQGLTDSRHIDAKKMLIGVAIVIGIAFSWVGATQFAQSTYSTDFNAPFFITWFATAWMVLVFPLYSLPSLLRGKKISSFYRYAQQKEKRKKKKRKKLTSQIQSTLKPTHPAYY